MGVLSDVEMLYRMRRLGLVNGAPVDVPEGSTLCERHAVTPDGYSIPLMRADDPNRLEVEPFCGFTKTEGHPSHGLGSYGIDLRLGARYKWLDRHKLAAMGIPYVRPGMKNLPWREECLTPECPMMIVPARSAVLAEVMERIRVPRDCAGSIYTKSTWARLFIDLNTTPAEPTWDGVLTLEVTNQSDVAVGIELGEGIAQVVFHTANEPGRFPLRVGYADRNNPTYQHQTGVWEARA